MKKCIKRIMNIDIRRLKESKLDEQGIYIEFDENDITTANVMVVGPKDSLYEGGYLFFTVKFPSNYPFSPPHVKYHSNSNVRIHPNIYVNGKVCLSILGTWSGPEWTAAMDISNIFITIQSLLDTNPLKHEPGYDTSDRYNNLYNRYNRVIQYNTIHSLVFRRLDNDLGEFNIFRNTINKTYISNKIFLSDKIQKNIDEECNISVPLYHINECISYKKLDKLFKKFDLLIV